MKKKILWIILLILGFVPFIMVLHLGMNNAINGLERGFCLSGDCTKYYGFSAFIDTIVLISYVFWPFYILGFVLIIFSIAKLLKNKKDIKN